jgi:hypothetical protein
VLCHVRKPAMTSVTRGEALKIVKDIKCFFDLLVRRYDERKYPPDDYKELLGAFQAPHRVGEANIRLALRWKYGKSDGSALAESRLATIQRMTVRWKHVMWTERPECWLEALRDPDRRAHDFVSRAFLVHLCAPDKVPIIDRFSHRAVRYLLGTQRKGFPVGGLPRSSGDLLLVQRFSERMIEVWPGSKPSHSTFDRFLMVFGKNIAPPFSHRKPRG